MSKEERLTAGTESASRTVAMLLTHRARCPGELDGLVPAAAELVKTDAFARLVGMVFQRGMDWRRAFQVPLDIREKVGLESQFIASMNHGQREALLREIPTQLRWGPKIGALTLGGAAALAVECGGAENIWAASVWEVESRLQTIHGVGPGIAAMCCRILHDSFGEFVGQERHIDVKPDVHVRRVFERTGIARPPASESDTVRAARRLSPDYPAALDPPAWHVGRTWCRPRAPACGSCPVVDACPGHGVRRRDRSQLTETSMPEAQAGNDPRPAGMSGVGTPGTIGEADRRDPRPCLDTGPQGSGSRR